MKLLNLICLFCFFSFWYNLIAQDRTHSVYFYGSESLDNRDQNPAYSEGNTSQLAITGTAITLEAWIFPVMLPPRGWKNTIVARSHSWPRVSSYELCIDYMDGVEDPRLALIISDGGNPVQTCMVRDVQVLQLGIGMHVAGTYDGSMLRLYINGNEVNSESCTFSIGEIAVSDNAIGIGNDIRASNDAFQGLINEVRIWSVTRSPEELLNNYQSQLVGNETALVGYWPLEEVVSFEIETNNFALLTLDITANANHLWVGDDRLPFVNLTPQNPGSNSTLSFSESTFDFDIIEVGNLSDKRYITLTNSGDAIAFGTVTCDNADIELQIVNRLEWLDWFEDYFERYAILPESSLEMEIQILPNIEGNFSANFIIDGNSTGMPQYIPITVQSKPHKKFDANNIAMWVSRNGVFANDPYRRQDPGLEWIRGSGQELVFSSGVWVGAIMQDDFGTNVHASVNASSDYHVCFYPGPVGGNQYAYENRVYKISEANPYPEDYTNWPLHLGAPVTPNGDPLLLGDQTLFLVYNDSIQDRVNQINSWPLGAEVQQTIFGADFPNARGNTVFMRFRIFNRSQINWEKTFFGLWSDPDIGYFLDDYVGIDTTLNMAYAYNADNEDDVYGTAPPAVGYVILKGAFYSKPIQAFSMYAVLGTEYSVPRNQNECYNNLRGFIKDGNPYVDHTSGTETTFPLSGDPVTQTGWYDSSPGDRRFMISTGPFDLQPGQSKELVAAIIAARGDCDTCSITALRDSARVIIDLYKNGGIFGGAIENVAVIQIEPNVEETLDDIENSGAQLTAQAGVDGATLEVASFIEAPTEAAEITHSAIHGVGKYLDVQAIGIEGNIDIQIYYTQNDLDQQDKTEAELAGIYFWDASLAEPTWVLYDNTGVDKTNINLDGTDYEGYAWADADHLTLMRIGSFIDSTLNIPQDENVKMPYNYALAQNYPNPFNPSTSIKFSLPNPEYVELKVYNILGKEVADLVSHNLPTGIHQYQFDGSNLASGIYYYQIVAGEYMEVKKMILLR